MSLKRRSLLRCRYCKHLLAPNYCQKRNLILKKGARRNVCRKFSPTNYFYCENYGQRYDIKTCLFRRECAIHKVRLFESFPKCEKCEQYIEIKKIADICGFDTPHVLKIKRRKPKQKSLVHIIKRRSKPTKIKRRAKNQKLTSNNMEISKLRRRKSKREITNQKIRRRKKS
jgi:carbamoylphosphate synthase small subunit